ncbi:hypothetical protein [Micromonospora sp. NBC_01638]|uniref:hypothetical protein n=1 Tax=Micromonospora sp. NBC_01638 TaxID=2975982 RepID=UPI003864490D|nr:hypothetical protein OG811_19520 [Micromonospora sp. NBC_01638]
MPVHRGGRRQLGEQLALLLDGASARSRVLNTETLATAAAIAAVLVDNAIPTAAVPAGAGGNQSAGQATHTPA